MAQVKSSLPPINVPLIERGPSGEYLVSDQWYRFFETLRARTGGDMDKVEAATTAVKGAAEAAEGANAAAAAANAAAGTANAAITEVNSRVVDLDNRVVALEEA